MQWFTLALLRFFLCNFASLLNIFRSLVSLKFISSMRQTLFFDSLLNSCQRFARWSKILLIFFKSDLFFIINIQKCQNEQIFFWLLAYKFKKEKKNLKRFLAKQRTNMHNVKWTIMKSSPSHSSYSIIMKV